MTNCEKITRITELLSEASKLCNSMRDHISFSQFDEKIELFIRPSLFDEYLIEEKREEHNRTTDKVSATVNGVEVFCLKPWEGRK